jgi:SAM-dependent methyltransferase
MERREIDINEIRFEPASLIDNPGRVFHWKDGIYRGIREGYADFYRDLLKSDKVSSVFEQGLIPGEEITDSFLHGFDLILKHRRIPVISYISEWNAQMIKDAALLICNLGRELAKLELTIKDVHPWNILFDLGGKPYFIDWGSLAPLTEQRRWPHGVIRDRYFMPMYLKYVGKDSLARRFLMDTSTSIDPTDISKLLRSWKDPMKYLDWKWKSFSMSMGSKRMDSRYFDRIERIIESIPIRVGKTEWSGYSEEGEELTHTYSDHWPMRIKSVYGKLTQYKPGTVLDIGSNKGWFSELAEGLGADVIAVDIDEESVIELYQRLKTNNRSILPLVMDFIFPTNSHGMLNCYPSAEDRFSSDMVMVLAVTHHLVFKRDLNFEVISNALAKFSKKWLLVEFVPADDIHVKKWIADSGQDYSWYNIENFIDSLQEDFRDFEILESSPEPRKLVFCHRK